MSDLKFRVSRDQGSRTTYYQHDDRDERIVKFKSNGNGGGRRRRRDNHLKQADGRSTFYDEEGDVQMEADNEPSRKSRFVPYEARGGFSRGKNRRQPRRWSRGGPPDGGYNQRNDRNSRSNSNWFRIVIPKMINVDKNLILKIIAQKSHVPFVPFNFNYEGTYAIFHVEGRECAKAIERLNGEITLPNGHKMVIKAYPSSQPPEIPLDDVVLGKIKQAMDKRYNSDTKSLDLSSFVNDIEFKNTGVYISLNRKNVFTSIIEIIEAHIPELLALNLADNKLTAEQLALMAGKLKSIKILSLAGNCLKSLNDLNSIRELSLEELVVLRNPLCDNNKDQAAFVSAIRQKFPKVVRLDGQELPPAYGFDVEPETILPTSQGNFFSDETVRGIVPQFLEQYFTFYDGGDRQSLLAAYHDQAVFSMSAVSFLKGGMSAGNTNTNQFNTYIHESRNLLKVTQLNRRQKLLRQGKINIISYLIQLPKTQHDPMSFSIDVPHFSNSLLTVSCSGVFKEVESKPGTPIRAFSRVFILVPQGAGFCIINEMLFVTHATSDQAKAAFKVPAPTPSPSPVPPSLTNIPNAEQQEQMVLMFSQQSGMNIEWSMKCLQENDWDFARSASVFQQYNKNGQIPPEAFIKSE